MQAKNWPKQDQRLFDDPFDRKASYVGEVTTWQGGKIHSYHPILERLRQRGWSRRISLASMDREGWPEVEGYIYKWWKLESTALNAFQFMPKKDKTLIDLGCGFSPDAEIFMRQGGKKAYKQDLFPIHDWMDDAKFIQADFVEEIPVRADYAIAQAVINLIEPNSRARFYQNVHGCLKKDGYFAVYICKLKNEWPWSLREEVDRMLNNGFGYCGMIPGGALMKKLP